MYTNVQHIIPLRDWLSRDAVFSASLSDMVCTLSGYILACLYHVCRYGNRLCVNWYTPCANTNEMTTYLDQSFPVIYTVHFNSLLGGSSNSTLFLLCTKGKTRGQRMMT